MNLQKTAKSGLPIIAISFIIFSCSNEPQGLEDLEPVCFQSEVLPLIQYSCAVSGCHDGNGEEGPVLTNYQNILSEVKPGNARRSKLYMVLSDIHGEMMPPDQPLSMDNRNLIKIWIEQGALNTTCENTTGIPSQNKDTVCFNLDILPLLSSSCAISGCHDAITAEEGYRLTNYENIALNRNLVKPGNFAESKLFEVITENGKERMPPEPANPLNQDQINKIKKWISDGALNSNCQVTKCDTAGTISYSSQVWGIIQNNCLGCHPASGSSNAINLGNFSQVKTVAATTRNGTSLLSGSVLQKSGFVAMPRNGKLDNCRISIIDKWISQGMANN